MKIGIIGGGLMGLAAAERLSAAGHQVTVFERDQQVGGLATWHDFGRFVWDKFYHVILPTDVHLLGFIKSLGLDDDLCWQETQTGFYVDQAFHPLNDNWDFLKFPPLSLWGKMRLALTILYAARINDWQRLEKIPVEDWLLKVSGRATYEKLWKPLLLAKLGENYRRVSAVFIWSYIKRLFSARDSAARKEHMGYLRGGYQRLFTCLQQRLHERGGVIHTSCAVEAITAAEDAGLWIQHQGKKELFDRVICTSPLDVVQRLVSQDLAKVQEGAGGVEYLGVICLALVTRKELLPYYVLNIADGDIPFTGVIGMSSVVSTAETDGLYLTYLPKYLLSSDPLLQADDHTLREMFLQGLQRLLPDFSADDIVAVTVNRAVKVQPLQVLNYSQRVPKCTTNHPDFFVLNTSQFVNNTLNNNEVIRAVDEFMQTYAADFSSGAKGRQQRQPLASVA